MNTQTDINDLWSEVKYLAFDTVNNNNYGNIDTAEEKLTQIFWLLLPNSTAKIYKFAGKVDCEDLLKMFKHIYAINVEAHKIPLNYIISKMEEEVIYKTRIHERDFFLFANVLISFLAQYENEHIFVNLRKIITRERQSRL